LILTKTPLHKNVQTTHTQSFLEMCIMMLPGNIIHSTLLWKNSAAKSSSIFDLLLQKHWRILTPKTRSKRIATTWRDSDGARIEGANSREKKAHGMLSHHVNSVHCRVSPRHWFVTHFLSTRFSSLAHSHVFICSECWFDATH